MFPVPQKFCYNDEILRMLGYYEHRLQRSISFLLVAIRTSVQDPRPINNEELFLLCNGSFTLLELDSYSDSKPPRPVHIAQTRTRIPTPYFCTGQESVSESNSSNVNEP